MVILVIGLAASGYLFLTGETPDGGGLDEYAGSKVYRRELERHGGKLTVVADDLARGVAGKGPALMVALLTLAVGGGLFIAAGRNHETERKQDHDPDR
jgi:hypothetical protein